MSALKVTLVAGQQRGKAKKVKVDKMLALLPAVLFYCNNTVLPMKRIVVQLEQAELSCSAVSPVHEF
ncbi:hypothetical protein M5K25_004204 [Dendrobium thyrsiflorum]|uniref:Uncharacterized protein n=1 Tax=Dendrobium thyrsiflorum TaxID=117978 RepID=A0ABD0VL74_DENTH